MKKIILVAATGVILIGCVITSEVAGQRAAGRLAVTQSESAPEEDKRFVLGDEHGRLVVYRRGESTPFMTTDTFTYTLPKSDRQKLARGIEVQGEAALRRTLEDYCS